MPGEISPNMIGTPCTTTATNKEWIYYHFLLPLTMSSNDLAMIESQQVWQKYKNLALCFESGTNWEIFFNIGNIETHYHRYPEVDTPVETTFHPTDLQSTIPIRQGKSLNVYTKSYIMPCYAVCNLKMRQLNTAPGGRKNAKLFCFSVATETDKIVENALRVIRENNDGVDYDDPISGLLYENLLRKALNAMTQMCRCSGIFYLYGSPKTLNILSTSNDHKFLFPSVSRLRVSNRQG
jgi:hypothetical protein